MNWKQPMYFGSELGRYAICPNCNAKINFYDDAYDIPGRAGGGLIPTPPAARDIEMWQCPEKSCNKIYFPGQLEFKVDMPNEQDKKPYTILIKHEVNDSVSMAHCVGWGDLIAQLTRLSPQDRPTVKIDPDNIKEGDDNDEARPEQLRIVIIEGKKLPTKPDNLDITVQATYEEEF